MVPRAQFFVILLAVLAAGLYLGHRPRRTDALHAEGDVVIPPSLAPTPAPARAAMPPPALAEVKATLERLFGPVLVVDARSEPAFLAGDFNGDDSTDLAVVVRPASKEAVRQINGELADWGLQDALAPRLPAGAGGPATSVSLGERLLAVVHGVGEHGWRHPEGLQCYLVKNAAGARLSTQPLADLPLDVRMHAIRTHVGEVIVADHAGAPALILWTGAAYVAAPEPEQGS